MCGWISVFFKKKKIDNKFYHTPLLPPHPRVRSKWERKLDDLYIYIPLNVWQFGVVIADPITLERWLNEPTGRIIERSDASFEVQMRSEYSELYACNRGDALMTVWGENIIIAERNKNAVAPPVMTVLIGACTLSMSNVRLVYVRVW